MFYDPMISKLITWGKDRKEAMDLLNKSFDEYVVQGVAHNIGFGKSIVNNESFIKGDYSTAFIPTFYPDGYSGEILTSLNQQVLALACHQMKNIASGVYKSA
jgi:propionyl-CoA carboxylase alpha chain